MKRKSKNTQSSTQANPDNSWRLAHCRKEFFPKDPPPYKFQVGDLVSIGHLKDPTIDEVIDDGLIYKIGNNYWYWNEVFPADGDRSDQISYTEPWSLSFSCRVIEGLIGSCYTCGFSRPDYQRDYIWSPEDKVALIESIFDNIDIGKFVINNLNSYEPGRANYEIIDGQQRLRALLDFNESKFQFRGKYFYELCWWDRHHFKDYRISVAETTKLPYKDQLKLFIKLNTSGKVMDIAHIEKVKQMLNST
jgi:hypothetical protein